MADKLPKVCIFGAQGVELFSSPECPDFETRALDCKCYADDKDLARILALEQPNVLLTIGKDSASFSRLAHSSPEVTRRWIHFDKSSDLAEMGASAFFCFVDSCVRERTDLPPLVSVFTPTFHTGARIQRPYESLRAQTYDNWEWILVDDSNDDGQTFQMLSRMARADHRLGVFKHHAHSGVIGKVKRWACRLANGQLLLELDHDDELTPNCLADVVQAFRYFDGSAPDRPRAGFVYNDFAETYPDGGAYTYGDDFALGYGSYRWEHWGTRTFAVCNTPNINPKTIRHIVGVPNHVRAWHRDCYQEAGGHARELHVADDYELLVRTFLTSRMARVPRLGYVQWRNEPDGAIAGGNTHQERNKEIQRLTRAVCQRYDLAIHQRFLQLGIDDFVWKDGEDTFLRMMAVPNPPKEPHCTLLLPEHAWA